MIVCSSRCGFCGRCDDNPRPLEREQPADLACAVCGDPIVGGFSRVTVAGVGPVCSALCSDTAVNLSLQKGAAA